MKNFITILSLTIFSLTVLSANNTPSEGVVSVENLQIFETAGFNVESQTLDLTTKSDIAVIQIYNLAGELEFQLPVMSDNVQLKRNMFDGETHKLGFVMQGSNQVHFTNVTVK